jgi:2-polyprenyl-3-methyl-5-hydroxy-6-metoxy-1,4-benzoquinol methylase
MKPLDRWLRRWRLAKAAAAIPKGTRVLDVGCGDGALFRLLGDRISFGLGIDPALISGAESGRTRLIAGAFPEAMPKAGPFDVITLLAVLEHVPREQQDSFLHACAGRLAPGGLLVITVPSPQVDALLRGLKALRLVEGIALEQHYGFRPETTPTLCAAHGLRLLQHRRFQLGLNNLFVFQKPQP